MKESIRKIFRRCVALLATLALVVTGSGLTTVFAGTDPIADIAPAGTTNVAGTATITISNGTNLYQSENTYEPQDVLEWSKHFLTDGDLSRGWSTHPNDQEPDRTHPVTLTFDLGQRYTLSEIALFPKGKSASFTSGGVFPTDYTVSVSEDGEQWQQVAVSTDNAKEPAQANTHSFTPTYAKYVQINVTKRYGEDSAGGGNNNDGKLVQLGEVAIYGNTDTIAVSGDKTSIESYKPAGYENVALNKMVESSSSYEKSDEGWCNANLVDGMLGVAGAALANGWTTMPKETTDATKLAWVKVDLGTEYAARRIVLFPRSDGATYGESFPSTFQVQLSENQQTWSDVYSVTTMARPTEPVVIDLPDLPAGRYVRVYVTGREGVASTSGGGAADGKMVQLSEMAVFGKMTKTSVTPDKTSLELLPDESDKVTLKVLSDSPVEQVFTWSSDDETIATVDQDGNVTAHAVGSTQIHITNTTLNLDEVVDVTVVAKKFSFDDNILVTIFWPPTLEYMSGAADDSLWDEQYKLLADAGVNLINNVTGNDLNAKETNLKMAAYAYKYGMRLSVADGRMGGTLLNTAPEDIVSLINEYRNVPGVAGYYICDEPFNPNTYSDVYKAIKTADPSAYAHLNFLPYGCYKNTQEYMDQMNDWLCLNEATGYKQDYLMYDLYPYGDNSTDMNRVGFLENMNATRLVGLQHDVKTGTYLQSVRIPGAYRCPAVSEIRYEAMMAMAYGYKQVSYFTWFTPSNRSEPFADGIIGLDGQPNAKTYDGVCAINAELHALGSTLINLDSQEVYLNGTTWGQESIPADFFAQPKDKVNYTVSYLRDKTTGRNYMMVVNNDYTNAASMTLALSDKITGLEQVSAQDGSFSPVTLGAGNTLALDLAAGDGALFALPEGYDYDTPYVPAAGENLAANALIVADTSVGASGWYISKLNDGIRQSDDSKSSNGWKSTKSTAMLNVDLNAETDFNRIDLYPQGDMFSYGDGMPKDFTVQVLNADGQWETVKTVTGLTMNGTTPPSIVLDTAAHGRYIRLEVTAANASFVSLAEIEIYNDDGTVPAPVSPVMGKDEVVTYAPGDDLLLKTKLAVSSTTPDAMYDQWGWASYRLNDGIYTGGWTSNVKVNFDQATAHEWCAFYMGDLFAVNKVKIQVLANSAFPIDYTVDVSLDGRTWTTIKTVTGDNGDQAGTRDFVLDEPVNAKFIRINGTKLKLSGADGYLMQVGEVEAYGTPVVDTAAAEEMVKTADAAKAKMDGADVSAVNTAQSAVNKAISNVANNRTTQTQLNDLTGKLKAAVDALLGLGVDKTALTKAITDAKAADTSSATTLTIKALTDALKAAQNVFDDDTVTPRQVADATKNLTDALRGLAQRNDGAVVYSYDAPTYEGISKTLLPDGYNGTEPVNYDAANGTYCLKNDSEVYYNFTLAQPTTVTFGVSYVARQPKEGCARAIDFAVDNGTHTTCELLPSKADNGPCYFTYTVKLDAGKHVFSLYVPTGFDDVVLKSCDVVSVTLDRVPQTDFSALTAAIATAKKVETDYYTEASVTPFLAKLQEAQDALTTKNIEQTDADDALASLQDTVKNLKWVGNYGNVLKKETLGGQVAVRLDAPCVELVKVQIDAQVADPKSDYVVTKGSTIITLTKAYVDTLSAGEHTLTATFQSANGETKDFKVPFTVTKPAASTSTTTTTTSTTTGSPKTGDTSNMLLWIILMVVCVAAIVAILLVFKKKNNEKKS